MKIKTVLWGLATAALLVSCSGAKLSVANEQYARGEFYDAAQTYRKVYSKTNPRKERKLRGEIAFKMAECYRHINMAPRSSAAYQNAIRYDYPDSMALFYLARSQQYEGKYKEAIKNYQAYLETNPQSSLAKNGIRGCNLAQQWKKNAYTVYREKSNHVQLSTERFRTDVFRRRFRPSLFLLVYRKGIGQE